MPEFKPGQRVIAHIPGEVIITNPDGSVEITYDGVGDHTDYGVDWLDPSWIEVVPDPVKVGDAATLEVLEALPYRSVVVTANNVVYQRGVSGRWLTLHGLRAETEYLGRLGAKVAHIAGVAE